MRNLRKLFLMFIDFCMVAIAYFLVVMLIRSDFMSFLKTPQATYSVIVTGVSIIIALNVIDFYSSLWVYTGTKEYFSGFLASIGAVAIVGLATGFFGNYFLPYKYVVTSGIVSIIMCLGYRVGIKVVYAFLEEYFAETNVVNVKTNLLIIGAGDSAALAIRGIRNDKYSNYNIVGLVDDNLRKNGSLVYGIKIIGTRDDIIDICEEKNVKEILLAIPSISEKDKYEILNICANTSCKIKILPKSMGILGDVKVNKDARDIQIEDLLPRDVIELDIDDISEDLSDKVILVTGGGGSIGSELCRQIAAFKPKKLVIVDIYENNAYDIQNELKDIAPELDIEVLIASVRDKNRLDKIFEKIKPEVVFHAAAHKHVPLMEDSSCEAVKNNIVGTLNACLVSDKHNVKKFILISTDKAVNPTNIMGATKRVCEMIIQGINKISNTKFVAVRFGNVLGSNGSVVPLFKKQITNGGPVTITHKDITRYFMTIPEAAQLVMEAGVFANGGEIFVLDMGEPVKIYDLAEKMIKLSGLTVGRDIDIVVTGLRPGEKLYEELLMDEEGLSSTKNKKIFVAKPNDIDFEKLKEDIDVLLKYANEEDSQSIRYKLKCLVPSFKEETNY